MSDKSIAEKLLIKENYTVTLINEPDNYRADLGKLPENVTVLNEAFEPVDLLQVFLTTEVELKTELADLKSCLKPGALLWLTYPKGTSRMKTDINRDSIREYAEQNGFKAVAMISVDEIWSALRLRLFRKD